MVLVIKKILLSSAPGQWLFIKILPIYRRIKYGDKDILVIRNELELISSALEAITMLYIKNNKEILAIRDDLRVISDSLEALTILHIKNDTK